MPVRRPRPESPVLYDAFPVTWGWCAAARTPAGLCHLVLPVADEAAALKAIHEAHPDAQRDSAPFKKLIAATERYFEGWTTRFDEFDLDLSRGSEFQQRVWGIIRRIPYGQVRSYRWIGMEIGRPDAARAIGGAAGANPLPLIIPCHRVVGQSGELAGFSAEGGIALKARMLEREGVPLFRAGETVRVMAEKVKRL